MTWDEFIDDAELNGLLDKSFSELLDELLRLVKHDGGIVMDQQIYQLIPKVMAEVGAIEKARKNEQQKYFFRGIDDVMAAFQPVLAKHQIFYVPELVSREVTDRESKNGANLIYTTLTMAYTFYAPDGSNVRAVVVGEAMDSGDKSSNKAMSAALKYALLQIFCVPTESEDADADATSHEVKRAPAKPTDEIRRLCRELKYSDASLLNWLIKTFAIDRNCTLSRALEVLEPHEIERAVNVFKAQLEGKAA